MIRQRKFSQQLISRQLVGFLIAAMAACGPAQKQSVRIRLQFSEIANESTHSAQSRYSANQALPIELCYHLHMAGPNIVGPGKIDTQCGPEFGTGRIEGPFTVGQEVVILVPEGQTNFELLGYPKSGGICENIKLEVGSENGLPVAKLFSGSTLLSDTKALVAFGKASADIVAGDNLVVMSAIAKDANSSYSFGAPFLQSDRSSSPCAGVAPSVPATALSWQTASPSANAAQLVTWVPSTAPELESQKIGLFTDSLCTTAVAASVNLAKTDSSSVLSIPSDGNFYFGVSSVGSRGASLMACSALMEIDTLAPLLASSTVSNSSPTNSSLFNLSHGSVSNGTYSDYCILENDTNVGNCSFASGTIPTSWGVNAANNSKTLSIWLRDAAGNVSARVDTNSVVLDTISPSLASADIANGSPTATTVYSLNFGAVTDGPFDAYCILENDTNESNCTYVSSGTLPASYTVSAINGAKTLSVWLKDAAGNVSTRVDSDTVSLQQTAVLTATPSPHSFGTVAVGSTNVIGITVSNAGSGAASTIAEGSPLVAPFQYSGGSYPGTGGTCGTSLAAGANCSLIVEFTPASTGLTTEVVDVSYYDGTSNQSLTVNLDGTGANPALLSISDGLTYDYGNVVVGGSSQKTFTITNSGGVAATTLSEASPLSAPFQLSGGFPGTGGTCGATLASGANCTIVVNYDPTASGVHADTIMIGYIDGAVSQSTSRAIQGTGAAPALLEISDPAWDFGTVSPGNPADKIFTISNTGATTATALGVGTALTAPFSYKGGAFPGTGGDCAASIGAGASCTIVVTYAPTVGGPDSDTIDISYYNGLAVTNSLRAISGTGDSVPVAGLTGTPPSPNGATTLNVTVSGSNVSQYKHKVTASGAGDCSNSAGYSAATPVATLITEDISAFPDGTLHLCVIGGSALETWQTYASSTFASWVQDETAPDVLAMSLSNSPWHGSPTSSPTITILGAATDNSGIDFYEIALGTSPGGSDIQGWTDIGVVGSHSFTGLSLTEGQSYYASLRVVDFVGNVSSDFSNSWQVDLTPPTAPGAISFNLAGSSGTDSPEFAWAPASDPAGSGISDYEFMIEDSVPVTIVGWTSTPSSPHRETGLPPSSFVPGNNYTVRVRARDQAGNIGPDSSDFWVHPSPMRWDPGDLVNIVLSELNQRADTIAGNGSCSGVRASGSAFTEGQAPIYYEVVGLNLSTYPDAFVGFADMSHTLSNCANNNAMPTWGISLSSASSNFFANGEVVGSCAPGTGFWWDAGVKIGIGLDLSDTTPSLKIWRNGVLRCTLALPANHFNGRNVKPFVGRDVAAGSVLPHIRGYFTTNDITGTNASTIPAGYQAVGGP